MACFSVGDQVTIRYGSQQDQKATIMKSQPGEDAYRVKVADGTIRFYSSKGLKKEKAVAVGNLVGELVGDL